MKIYDILWKGYLDETTFEDFLYFYFPDEVKKIDVKRGFVFLDKELDSIFKQDTNLIETRFVDKLVKLFLHSGEENWILIHIEVQGYQDASFGERMFTYYTRIWEKYKMPITSIAIFTDNRKKYHPKCYESSFMGTRILYEFNTYKVLDQDEALLRKSNNPFAIVILVVLLALKKNPEKELEILGLRLDLLDHLKEKQFPREKIIKILTFIKLYVQFENKEYNKIFEEKMNIFITQNYNYMTIENLMIEVKKQEGIRETEIRKSKQFVINLLNEKIYSVEKIASLASVTEEFVLEVIQSQSIQ